MRVATTATSTVTGIMMGSKPAPFDIFDIPSCPPGLQGSLGSIVDGTLATVIKKDRIPNYTHTNTECA